MSNDLKQAAQQALEWANNHGEIVFAGGGMRAVGGMDAWVQALRAALGQQREQDSPPRQMPEWMDYDQATDVLTIHGRRYSAAMFGERGFLSPAGTLLQVAEGQPDCVTLMTILPTEPK